MILVCARETLLKPISAKLISRRKERNMDSETFRLRDL